MSMLDDWRSKVAEFTDVAARLDQAETDLYAAYQLAVDVGSVDEWRSRFNDINALKSIVGSTLDLIAKAGSVWDTVTDTLGLGRVRQLGAVQIGLPITLATLGGLIAAGTASVVAVYSAIQSWKLKRERQLRESGMTPREAAATVDGTYPTTGQSWSEAVPESFMWIALAVGAAFVLPRLMKGKR